MTAPVPSPLLNFQLTLRAPEGVSPTALLASYDSYVNGDPPPVAELHRAVQICELDGWRLTADITVPFGEPPFPVLVYLHGGGWAMGSPWTHRRLTADLTTLGMLVVSLDYRRAPKYRFPAAVEDATLGVAWTSEHARSYGGDPSRLLVGGDSAGANLAAGLLASGAGTDVAGALLFYGIYDYHRALPVITPLLGGPRSDSQLYLRPEDFEAARDDPRLSPENHAAALPPTLVIVGGRDPLLEESTALAVQLNAAKVPHELVIIDDAPHGFLQLPTHPAHAVGLGSIEGFLARQGFAASKS